MGQDFWNQFLECAAVQPAQQARGAANSQHRWWDDGILDFQAILVFLFKNEVLKCKFNILNYNLQYQPKSITMLNDEMNHSFAFAFHEDRKVRQVMCHICCAEFGTTSLKIHQDTCQKRHEWCAIL